MLLEALRRALNQDRTIDIVTTGAKSNVPRTIEIWFTKIGAEVFICGTPSADGSPGRRRRRDWLANLLAHPEFDFVLKESVDAVLPAIATVVTDRAERTRVFTAPETQWYREQSVSLDRLVDDGPLVKVTFLGEAEPLNRTVWPIVSRSDLQHHLTAGRTTPSGRRAANVPDPPQPMRARAPRHSGTGTPTGGGRGERRRRRGGRP